MNCRRHPDAAGPYWCQDCHGVHEIARPEPVDLPDSRPPRTPPPWYIDLPPEEWPGRDDRQLILSELLDVLQKARESQAEWYVEALAVRAGERDS